MKAHAVVRVDAADHGVRFRTLRSDPPLLLRPTPEALQLVGGAAGPLGGDEMSYDIDIGAGARLVVRSVAATIVLPGASTSTLAARVSVDSHAELDWAPEPLVSVTGSRHQQHTVVRLSPSAAARWRELVVLGRSGEEPGTLVSTLRVERAGRVICHHETRIGESARGWNGPAGLGAGRVMLSEFRAGGANHFTRSARDGTTWAAVFSLATDASLSVAAGPALGHVTDMLDTLAADCGAGQ